MLPVSVTYYVSPCRSLCAACRLCGLLCLFAPCYRSVCLPGPLPFSAVWSDSFLGQWRQFVKPHWSVHFLRMCKRMPFITKPVLSVCLLLPCVYMRREGGRNSNTARRERNRDSTGVWMLKRGWVVVTGSRGWRRRGEGRQHRQWRRQ